MAGGKGVGSLFAVSPAKRLPTPFPPARGLTWVGPRGTLTYPVQEFRGHVKITLNGDSVEVAGPLTVSELLSQLEIDPRRVAVEHNLTVLKRPRYESTLIGEGDAIEIVNFVGGGAV